MGKPALFEPDGQTPTSPAVEVGPGGDSTTGWPSSPMGGSKTGAIVRRDQHAGTGVRPFLHPDGRHLYFAWTVSEQIDLFVSTLTPLANGALGQPRLSAEHAGRRKRHGGGLGWPNGHFSRSIDGQLDLHGFTLPEAVAADPTAALRATSVLWMAWASRKAR